MSTFLKRLWTASTPLTFVTLLMLADFALAAVGLLLDPRTLGGAPVWMKPLKFGISTAIYTGTLAWLCAYLKERARLVRIAGLIIAAGLVLEIGLLDVQAARGVSSHFNTATAGDALIFGLMGSVIGIVWAASAFLAAGLFRQRFADRAWGWSLRLGTAITLLGAAGGGLMTTPTGAQLDAIRAGHKPTAIGAHTVGAPDGGPGLPGLGWSLDHGDLRVPHFIGLHAVQVIPLLCVAFGRRRRPVSLVFAMAGSYLALVVLFGWQALRGQSVAQPDGIMLSALGAWLMVSLAAGFVLTRNPARYQALA